jgi:hypothetical protein
LRFSGSAGFIQPASFHFSSSFSEFIRRVSQADLPNGIQLRWWLCQFHRVNPKKTKQKEIACQAVALAKAERPVVLVLFEISS